VFFIFIFALWDNVFASLNQTLDIDRVDIAERTITMIDELSVSLFFIVHSLILIWALL